MFAAGVAIAIAPPAPTQVPAGVPKTAQMTESMAKVAAHNGPRRDVRKVAKAYIMAGPQAHWAKLALERVYLGSRKRGALVL